MIKNHNHKSEFRQDPSEFKSSLLKYKDLREINTVKFGSQKPEKFQNYFLSFLSKDRSKHPTITIQNENYKPCKILNF